MIELTKEKLENLVLFTIKQTLKTNAEILSGCSSFEEYLKHSEQVVALLEAELASRE